MSEHSVDTQGVAEKPPARALSKILVAEDEHLVAINLADHLEKLGYQVIGPVANGAQAVALARQATPDLAIFDIRMDQMDGLSASKVVFNELGIPVILLTAYSNQEYLDQSRDSGVFGYLLKPATRDDLRATISTAWARFLDHQRLRDEVNNLKTELDNRKQIERAKGVLMEQLKLSEPEAMKRLHKFARDSRRKLIDAANAILETNHLLKDDKD